MLSGSGYPMGLITKLYNQMEKYMGVVELSSVWPSAANKSRTQRLQNALARVITYTKRAEHIHPILYNLHWQPINYRIQYKVATLAFTIWSTGSPAYLLPAVNLI